jgi:hypothetical protein
MTLPLVLRTIPATVRRHEPTYQRARATCPAFAPYATATVLLTVLATRDSRVPLDDRQHLVRAVITLHQTARHPLWQALLLHAFQPMLLSLRALDRGPAEDRDQRVLLAFLQALENPRLPSQPVFIALRRATARALFHAVRAQSSDFDTVPLDAAVDVPTRPAHADPAPFVTCLAHEMAERLVARDGGDDVARLLAGVETIAEQAERLAGDGTPPPSGNPISRTSLQQRRHRALFHLRAELARKPPRSAR